MVPPATVVAAKNFRVQFYYSLQQRRMSRLRRPTRKRSFDMKRGRVELKSVSSTKTAKIVDEMGLRRGTGCNEGGIILSKKPPEWRPVPAASRSQPQRNFPTATTFIRNNLLPQRHSSERLPSPRFDPEGWLPSWGAGRGGQARRACPPPDTGRGRGPSAASYRAAMTQMTMGGAGVSAANGVPPVPGLPALRTAALALSPGITPGTTPTTP